MIGRALALALGLLGKKPAEFAVCPAVQSQGGDRDGNPQQCKQGTDLPQEIPRLAPVIPNRILPVDQQACHQLHSGDNPGTQAGLGGSWQGKPGDLTDEQKAHSAGGEHTHMTKAPVQEFQGNVGAAPYGEKGGGFYDFQSKSPLGKDSQKNRKKFKKFLDKAPLHGYNKEADFGGAEIG